MSDKHQKITVKTLQAFLNIFNTQSISKETVDMIEMHPNNGTWNIVIHYK